MDFRSCTDWLICAPCLLGHKVTGATADFLVKTKQLFLFLSDIVVSGTDPNEGKTFFPKNTWILLLVFFLRGTFETLFKIYRAKLLLPISPHPTDQQGSPCCPNFLAVPSSYHSKVNLVGALDAEKLSAAVLLYVLWMGFPTSPFHSFFKRIEPLLSPFFLSLPSRENR